MVQNNKNYISNCKMNENPSRDPKFQFENQWLPPDINHLAKAV